LTSCESFSDNSSNNEQQLVGDSLFAGEPINVNDFKKKTRLDIDYIKSITTKGLTSFDMVDLYDNQKEFTLIEREDIIELITKIDVDKDSNVHVYPGYTGLKAYQWDEIDNYFLFTFFTESEECCVFQYCCVTDLKGEIQSMNSFGVNGGDGGWSIGEEAKLLHPGTYHFYCEESIVDYFDSMEVDQVEYTEYMFRLQGSGFVKSDLRSRIESDTTFFK
jgi:hypothetical protein